MARKVFVSSDMSQDEKLIDIAETNQQAVLMWPWLLTAFDDWGRAKASPKRLKASIFPALDIISADDIERALQDFARVGLIILYEVDGDRYMAIPQDKWYKYQTHMRRTNRRPGKDKMESDYPAPPQSPTDPHGDSRGVSGNIGDPVNPHGAPQFPVPSPSPSPNNIYLSSIYACEENDDPQSESFYTAHKRIFGFDCNPFQAKQLAKYIDEDGLEEAVVIRAMERAALKGKGYSFGLIRKILNDYLNSGAKTLEEAKALDAQFDSRAGLRPERRKSRWEQEQEYLRRFLEEEDEYDEGTNHGSSEPHQGGVREQIRDQRIYGESLV